MLKSTNINLSIYFSQEPILLLYFEDSTTTQGFYIPGHYQSIQACPDSLLMKNYNFLQNQNLSQRESISQPLPDNTVSGSQICGTTTDDQGKYYIF